MNFGVKRILGKTGLKIGRIGIFDVFHTRYNAAHRGAEKDVFPFMNSENRAGLVTFVSTKNGKLLDPKKMPEREAPLSSVDCYRFILSNPAVDACMCGAKNAKQMKENLKTLDMGPLNEEEMARIRRIGDYLHK
ncbi:aldo/keto reductase [Bacteroidota bacterium]